MTSHRIRVLVAGDIYADRAFVRPFLEDDGYEVAGEVYERADLMPTVIGRQPDAVVVSETMLAGRRPTKALQRIRRAAPDAKLVVVAEAPAAAFAEADATLEAGLSLAALTALLGRLFAEHAPRAAVPAGALVGAGAVAGATAARRSASEPRGSVARFVASIGVPLAVVWSLIALFTTGGGVVIPRADTTDLAAGGVVVIPKTDGPLSGARDSLDRLLHAIHAGNAELATAHAKALMDARASAIAFGYSTAELDAEVESGLAAVVGLLSPNATGSLAGILGSLFPEIQGETGSPTPGGGSGLNFRPATGSGGGTGSTGGSGNGNVDGDNTGGNQEHEGDGKAWGQSHKESRENGGGPPPWANGNGPPPWANGHGHEGDPGSDASEDARGHGHGHAYGHDKHGHGNNGGGED
jgi:hypothetical protein